jgi:hypothetical protein
MDRRNWLDLSRKLVDRTDFDYTMNAVQAAIAQASLSFFGEGVLATTLYPNPFPISESNTALGGIVGTGLAYDAVGNAIEISASPDETTSFVASASDPALPRWDLIVIEYAQVGDTPVPKPSDPITTIFLNLHDDFLLKVIAGTPSATPAYPAKGANDVILAGFRVPANATLGTQCTVDLSVRETGFADAVNIPVFQQMALSGVVNGTNQVFTLATQAFNPGSLLVKVDGRFLPQSEYTYDGNVTVTLNFAPALAQSVEGYWIENAASSTNPLSGAQEVPSGTVNGVNDTFTLAGQPANQVSSILMVDGLAVPLSGWQLIQGSAAQVKFLAGYIPAAGQTPYIFYFVNPATVGVGGGGGGSGGVTNAANVGTGLGLFEALSGSILEFKSLIAGTNINLTPTSTGITISATIPAGSGALSVQGSTGAPTQVDPTIGVPTTSDQRQLRFISSIAGSGAQVITENPQIAPGTIVGQELFLKGTSDTDYIVINDGNGVSQNGAIEFKNHFTGAYIWDGSVWSENGRT